MLLHVWFGAWTESRATGTSAARESGSANLAAATEEQARAQHDPHTLLALRLFRWICGPRPEIVVAMSPYRSEVVSPASLDGPTAERLTAVCNATQALAAPAAVPSQADSLRLELLHGWDDRPADIVALTWDHDEVVGWGSARFTRWDNPTAAELAKDIHPDHQRRRIGSQLLELLTSVCAERGRDRFDAYSWAAASSEHFLSSRGFRIAQHMAQRRIVPGGRDQRRATGSNSSRPGRVQRGSPARLRLGDVSPGAGGLPAARTSTGRRCLGRAHRQQPPHDRCQRCDWLPGRQPWHRLADLH